MSVTLRWFSDGFEVDSERWLCLGGEAGPARGDGSNSSSEIWSSWSRGPREPVLGNGSEGNGRSVSSSNSSTIAALRDILLVDVMDTVVAIINSHAPHAIHPSAVSTHLHLTVHFHNYSLALSGYALFNPFSQCKIKKIDKASQCHRANILFHVLPLVLVNHVQLILCDFSFGYLTKLIHY